MGRADNKYTGQDPSAMNTRPASAELMPRAVVVAQAPRTNAVATRKFRPIVSPRRAVQHPAAAG